MAHPRNAPYALASVLALAGCSRTELDLGDAAGDARFASVDAGLKAEASPPQALPATRLDLLFVVQNSPAMAGLQSILPASVQAMIDRLLDPDCVDSAGSLVGRSQGGLCPSGTLEFQPVHDLHVGVLTTSLGSLGGDACPADATNPGNAGLSAHNDDRGQLVIRTGASETPSPDASPAGFLAWFPSVPQNAGQPAPPVPALGDSSRLVGDFQAIASDVGVLGCGFTAPLEAWYRFLVQPDPYDQIAVSAGKASLVGVDATLLQQRRDFLRPDSAVAIVVVANENDRAVDPVSLAGQGWVFENLFFPGSTSGGGAPEGTVECRTTPLAPSCRSCAFVPPTDPGFAAECPPDPPAGTGGYLDPSNDAVNVRTFHMKQRFGVDVQFPVTRYVSGLSSTSVPDRAHEHDVNGAYAPLGNCRNPLFASGLPASPAGELCHLAPGPRQPSQVFLAVIAGVPHQLLQVDPAHPDSPQKASLTALDWTTILGTDPLGYDFSGADFHMLESIAPRAASGCPPTAADGCDPIHGREYDTGKSDLEFACTFPLDTPIDCTLPENTRGCACGPLALDGQSPLCQRSAGGGYTATQIAARAYPGIRPLSVARLLGPQAVISSICPIHPVESAAGDPLFGFRPGLMALVDRLRGALAR